MKTDHSFKIIAAIIIAGVIVAFASPTHSVAQPKTTAAKPVAAAHASADLSQ